ncbi:tryptophan halogenase family protein [Allosphingosinicella deserti]|uniref:Tryptophan halogenase n=1 Tax=Allosphingosinicella deserti TaxID=2116704 RepID=A0A2P7QFW1_9SPHN|nr:tryptophan halogenase family protein [Sphingomonas deserti]PSJ36882.1 tryptophan halogenase [Sphingomonas deserti]
MSDTGRPNTPLRDIVIVGGGTAGWMTAALLSKLFTRGYHIRLIESDEIGTIGVGEATIPAIRTYLQLAGIDTVEMIKATQATFKLGIEFVDWRDLGTSYIHGFGKIGQDMLWLHPHQLWLKMAARGQVKHFDHYALNCLAARKNRYCPPDPRQPGSPLADLDYAFHFDASLFAAFLRRQSEARGVERIEGRILSAKQRSEDGFVDHVVLADGRAVVGDLFIDCSGIRGLLIGDVLGVGYEDWNHWLPCDRALAVPCESAAVLTPYTRSTARSNGWQWRIPLQHRIGNGRVYSSHHGSDEEAAESLLANLDGRPIGDPRPVRFRPGMRHRSWDKNVVAIGLSGGFLEPLESTSIHLIQTAILRLIALFPGRAFNPADIAEYNRQTAFEYRDVRDFIIAHYKVTDREDTSFWAYVKHMDIPDSLAERLDLFRASARFFLHGKAELFREESWVQVLIGQGLPMHYDPMVDMIPEAQVTGYLRDIEEVIADVAERMPLHSDFIARQCRAPAANLS